MLVLVVLVVYILHSTKGYAGFAGPNHDKIVSCYYTNWAPYRNGPGIFDVSNIDASLCSHLIYAYVGLDENSSKIKCLDPIQDLDKNGGIGGLKRVAALKEQYKYLKTIVSIGGWGEGSVKYSKMAADPRLRSIFVKSVVQFLTTHKFDGLDLHWDSPTKRGGIPEDKTNYVSLIKEYSVKHLLGNGVTPSKIILDISMHGRTFIFKTPGVKSVVFGETETKFSGFTSEYSGGKGFIGYNEICVAIVNKSSHWVQAWHEPSSTPYLWDSERFISYDNPRSIANNVKFAMDHGLGGFAACSITTDDFRGVCDDELYTYREYVKRFNKISDQPILKEALVNLQKANDTIEFFVMKNDKVHLRLPQRKFLNYPLLRTIHDATSLALEEAKVLNEVQRLRGQSKSSSCTRSCTEVCYYGVDNSQVDTMKKEEVRLGLENKEEI